METKKEKLLFYLIVFFWVITIFKVTAQEKIVDNSLDKIKLAEQIPKEVISTMPTEELIQTYLNSRYPGYLLAYNSIQDAFDHAYNDFNGLRELLKREDAAQKLIEFYQKMNPDDYDQIWEPEKKGSFTFSFVFIEVLLSHESIHEKLTRSEVKTLLSELLEKNKFKTCHPETYSIIGVQFNVYSIARLLESKGKENGISQALFQSSDVRYLLKTGRLKNDDVLSFVIQKAEEFINTY
jgi:hypothetical protein